MCPMVTIIIPIYNREKTISRCIDSVLSQNLADMELLLVDDGSTDSTGSICDKYADRDRRVIVFHNTNHGVSYSRNFGLAHAKGKYILFIDSDDWIERDYVNGLVNIAEKEHVELVISTLKWNFGDRIEVYDMTQFQMMRNILSDYYYLQKFSGGMGKAIL